MSKLETKAIREQLERSQFHEHTHPYISPSFVFEDKEDMRASRRKKSAIYTRVSQTPIMKN